MELFQIFQLLSQNGSDPIWNAVDFVGKFNTGFTYLGINYDFIQTSQLSHRINSDLDPIWDIPTEKLDNVYNVNDIKPYLKRILHTLNLPTYQPNLVLSGQYLFSFFQHDHRHSHPILLRTSYFPISCVTSYFPFSWWTCCLIQGGVSGRVTSAKSVTSPGVKSRCYIERWRGGRGAIIKGNKDRGQVRASGDRGWC